MTLDERKIEIIKWITKVEDESVLYQVETLRQKTLNDLPEEIIKLLELSESAPEEELIEHTRSRDLLKQ